MRVRVSKATLKTIFFVVFIAIAIALTIFLIPVVQMLRTEEGRIQLEQHVKSYGALGPLIFICLQTIQIIIAIIPGEPIEILGGVLFGYLGGFILCMGGIVIGTVLVYYFVNIFGTSLVDKVVGSKTMQKFKILNDEKRLELLIFVLFLIPGTPKDTLTYLVPLTKIKPTKYFLYSTLARIPSVISSNIVGHNIGEGNVLISIIIFIVTLVIGLFGILYKDKIVDKTHKK